MLVSSINNTSNNPNFGMMNSIICCEGFSKSNPKHAVAINKVLHCDVIKKFGERYHFNAQLTLSQHTDPSNSYYGLKLIPLTKIELEECVSNKKAKKTTSTGFLKRIWDKLFGKKIEEKNLPGEILVTNAYDDREEVAFDSFLKKLECFDYRDLEIRLIDAIKKNNPPSIPQPNPDEVKEAFENIQNSPIPIK